jgi:hypothetical protein
MRPLASARIGYAGYSRDFSAPGDRRRFSAYARQRGLAYDFPDLWSDYDVVLVAQNADLTGWTARKREMGDKLRLILDLTDPYIGEDRLSLRLLMGVGRYVEGRESRLSPDFRRTLTQACRAADGVLCSTPEQRETLARYNSNIEVSFDWFDDELGPPKRAFRRDRRLKLVWEGQAGQLPNLQQLREPLNALKDRVELIVVTDPVTKRWFGRFGTIPSEEHLSGIEAPVTLVPWSRADFSNHIVAADVAVIPIDLSHPIWRGKPENKLVLLWKLGMPVLVAPTPAYRRAMASAGLDLVCATPDEWARNLADLTAAPPEKLMELGRRSRDFAERAYDVVAFRAPFDALFAKLGFSV